MFSPISILTTMDTLAIVISIVLAVVAIAGGIFGVLAYVTQRKQAKTQAEALANQFKQQEEARQKQLKEQEERQKHQTAEQFSKLKDELANQKSSADKNNLSVNMRLDSIEKKVDKFEDMHSQIAEIKTNSKFVFEMVKEIKEQLKHQTPTLSDVPELPKQRRRYTRKSK